MRRTRRGGDPTPNIWPGFTDALAGLVVALVFLLVLFFLFEVVLSRQVTGQEEIIGNLRSQVDRLAGMLGESEEERERLEERLAESRQRRQELDTELSRTREELAAVRERRQALERDLDAARSEREAREEELTETRQELSGARANLDVLSERVAALNERLERMERALALEEKERRAAEEQVSALEERVASQRERVGEQQERIQAMAEQIRTQLLERVEELERYRSEFFGRLREVFADNPNIEIRGDRFVFQSEILFPSGEASLSDEGGEQLQRFVAVFDQARDEIPEGLDMIIQVEGHTDRLPVRGGQFRSNWELSTARALSVVRALVEQGLPPRRLAAAGYGEYHPLTPGETEDQRRQNRRIELKITQR